MSTIATTTQPTPSLDTIQLQEQMMAEIADGSLGTTSVGGTTSTDGTDGTYLTPDALLLYCQTRLQGIDSQVQTFMTEQQNINNEQSGVQGLLNELAADASQAGSGNMSNSTECIAIEQKLENLISMMQQNDPASPQIAQLETLHDSIMATGSGPYPDPTNSSQTHGYYLTSTTNPPGPNGTTMPSSVAPSNGGPDSEISQSEFSTFSSTLTNVNNGLSSGAELNMIKVQSLMSDRTTAITLTTNILQSYDDGLSKVADNIGK